MKTTTFKLTLSKNTKISKPLFILDRRYDINKFLYEIALDYKIPFCMLWHRGWSLKIKSKSITNISRIKFHRSKRRI